ncbi:cytochrome P450 78A3 [Mariannaea sp. PMI_226]|nr:cytochrome P450 78A3 [Mariannaea sp. PMI_226]
MRSRELNGDTFYAIVISWTVTWCLYLIAWRCWIYPNYCSPLKHIPTVDGFPLWGQFFDIMTQECGVPQRRWHQQYGPIIRYFLLFGSERVSVANEDDLKRILTESPYNYCKPIRDKLWMSAIFGKGLLLAEGKEHDMQRKIVAPAFSTQSIRAMAPVIWEKALLMSKYLQDEISDADMGTKSIEISDWLNRATLDIIAKIGFGYDTKSLEAPTSRFRNACHTVFTCGFWSRICHAINASLPEFKCLPVQINQNMEQSHNIIINTASDIIRRKQEEATSDTVKDIMALITENNLSIQDAGERGLTFETMRDQVITFLGAGHDTTATAVAWALHLLSTHPKVQSQLRQEIRTHFPFLFESGTGFGTSRLADTDVDQLPYLDNVCRECFRYIPPIPLIVRETLVDDVLSGHYVPAGTVIYMVANTINHLPTYWGENADEFDPDRWDNLPTAWRNHAFMTFSHGPRACVGRKISETGMKIILCCLLSIFQFKRDESTIDPEANKTWKLALMPRDGVWLNVTVI